MLLSFAVKAEFAALRDLLRDPYKFCVQTKDTQIWYGLASIPHFGLSLRLSSAIGTTPVCDITQIWLVDLTFAWLANCRRLSKDCEHYSRSDENMIYVASIHLMLKRTRI